MMKMNFLKLVESTMSRMQRGGFLVGDVIKIKNMSDVPDELKDHVKDMSASGVNIKVVDIVNKYPSDKPGSSMNSNGEVSLVVALDYGGGRFVSHATIPTGCVEKLPVDDVANLDPIPDALRRDDKLNQKPEPVNREAQSQANQTTQTMSDQLADADHDLDMSNTELPSSPAEGVPSPGEFKQATHTGAYMPSE